MEKTAEQNTYNYKRVEGKNSLDLFVVNQFH